MLLRDWYGRDYAMTEMAAHTPQAVKIGGVLDGVLARAAGPDAVLTEKLRQAWPELLGPALAPQCGFVRFHGKIAVVEVVHPIWVVELNRMKRLLAAKMNTALGESRIADIRFIPAGRS